jgi:hypothetical protein
MPTTYPGGGPRVTVEALLRQPRLIARALTDLATKRFVADRIFARGSAEQVQGGAVLYQQSESIYTDRDPEEVGVRSRYPRAGWTEAILAAAVKKYGLEVPISDEAKRRNQLDVVQRAQRKLVNSVVKFVDGLAMSLFLNDANVLTFAGSGDWSTAATDIIFDVARAVNLIGLQDEGYEADTLIVNSAQELDLLVDKDVRDALPREGGIQNSVITGRAVPMLGLRQIVATNQLAAGTAIVTESQMVGTIADEQPGADENYMAFNPGAGMATVWVKVYREEGADETIVRAARFPAMWLAEPKAAVKITGV